MDESGTAQHPMASRAQVLRMTRAHLVPLAAMGVAANEAVTAWCEAVAVSDSDHATLRPKMEGVNATAIWTEAARRWVKTLRDVPVRVHDPYQWVELIFHEALHLRIHRQRPWSANTPRAEFFQMQLPCPDVEQAMAGRHEGNVELIAHPGPEGKAPIIRLHRRIAGEEMFEPFMVDPIAVRAQLVAWRSKDPDDVPWLEAAERMRSLATAPNTAVALTSAPSRRNVAALPGTGQDVRPTFRPHRRPDTAEQTGVE